MTSRPLVFTNGCFDLVHYGHVRLLEYCATLGRTVVGLNSDESIRRLKGPSRPISPLKSRTAVLEAIRWVDEVVVFDEETPLELIKKLSPDVLVKGGDYSEQEIVGFGLVPIRVFSLQGDFSTTKLVDRVRSGND